MNMESKVLKTTKEITSKIDSGVAKNSSVLTVVKSRQSSTLSRASSKQSSVNLVDRRPSSTNANKPRPATSFISTRVSHPSNPNISTDDKLQLSVHQLGKLPSYLRNRRPATTIGRLEQSVSSTSRKTDKLKEEPFQFHLPESTQRLKEPDATNNDSAREVCGPPCEGHGAGDAAFQEAVLLSRDLDLKDMLEKIGHLTAMCDQKQQRILQLEAEIAAQIKAVQERDEDIQKMKTSMSKIKSLSNTRDTVAREGLSDLEQKLDGLQKELAQKCHDLNRSKDKNLKLKQKLSETKAIVEERDGRIFELLEKDAERVEEIIAMKALCEDLKQQMSTLQSDLAAKDSLIAELRSRDPVKIAETEMEAYRMEIASLQSEIEQLRFENKMLISVKKQDEVMLQIRTKLLEHIERNKDAFRAQCERMGVSCDGGDRENSQSLDGLSDLFEKQRQRIEGGQICSGAECDGNGKGLSEQMLKMAKLLAKENKEMVDMVRSKCGSELPNEQREISEQFDEQNDTEHTNQEEAVEEEQESNRYDNSEEQITSITVYDDQILRDRE